MNFYHSKLCLLINPEESWHKIPLLCYKSYYQGWCHVLPRSVQPAGKWWAYLDGLVAQNLIRKWTFWTVITKLNFSLIQSEWWDPELLMTSKPLLEVYSWEIWACSFHNSSVTNLICFVCRLSGDSLSMGSPLCKLSSALQHFVIDFLLKT